MKSASLIATVSAASSATSVPFDLGELVGFSVAVVFSGSDLVGSVKLQGSLDNVSYVDVPSSSEDITSSGSYLYSVSQAQYRYVKVVWTYSSGTGNITVDALAKEPYKAST